MNPLDFLLRNPSGRDAGSIARQRLNARTTMPKSGGGVPGATGGFLANPIFAAYAFPGYAEQKARNAAGVIEGTRGPLNELQYIGGQLLKGRMPYGKPLNAIQTGKYGPTDWNPSANPLHTPTAPIRSGGAADRSYQQEKARVTQMTEQDPMFKKYQVAELTKAYNTASPEEKNKIGLQIWAATNPTLAKKVPPGQVGYQTSASMFGSQAFGTDVPGVTETIYSQAGQQEGVPGGVQFPGSEQATKMNAFSMGADAQQLGVTPPGTTPFPMIGENVFKRGFEVPSSEDLSQTQLALLKRAFESRIK